MHIVHEHRDEVPDTVARRGRGVLSIISSSSTTGRHGEIAPSCSDARRGNFHPAAAHLMSCEAHFTHAACLCLAQPMGLGPAPAQPQPHTSTPQCPSHPAGHPEVPIAPIAPLWPANSWVWSRPPMQPLLGWRAQRGWSWGLWDAEGLQHLPSCTQQQHRGCSGAGLFP